MSVNLNELFGTDYPSELLDSEFEVGRLWFVGGVKKSWRWLPVSKRSKSELAMINIRALQKCEVVLDCESNEEMCGVAKKLSDAGYSFWLWETGSRGFHVHLFFAELRDVSPEVRADVRKMFIKEFGGDKAKGSNRTEIAIENYSHFKSGNKKVLVNYFSCGNSGIPSDWLIPKPPTTKTCVERVVRTRRFCLAEPEGEAVDSERRIREALDKNPKVLDAVGLLSGENKPEDRSGKDYLIVKCLVENGVSKADIERFLRCLPHSKINSESSYFHLTFLNVYQDVQGAYRRKQGG